MMYVHPDVMTSIQQHDLHSTMVYDNLDHRSCVCYGKLVAPPPGLDGPACPTCGGLTRRTGTCATCIECGSTTGCG